MTAPRSIQVTLRMTHSQHEKLCLAAHILGVSIAQFIRDAVDERIALVAREKVR